MITFLAVPGEPVVLAFGPALPADTTSTISWFPGVPGWASRTSASNSCASVLYAPPAFEPQEWLAMRALFVYELLVSDVTEPLRLKPVGAVEDLRAAHPRARRHAEAVVEPLGILRGRAGRVVEAGDDRRVERPVAAAVPSVGIGREVVGVGDAGVRRRTTLVKVRMAGRRGPGVEPAVRQVDGEREGPGTEREGVVEGEVAGSARHQRVRPGERAGQDLVLALVVQLGLGRGEDRDDAWVLGQGRDLVTVELARTGSGTGRPWTSAAARGRGRGAACERERRRRPDSVWTASRCRPASLTPAPSLSAAV